MKFIGDRLGKWEKVKQGNLWDWIKDKTNYPDIPKVIINAKRQQNWLS